MYIYICIIYTHHHIPSKLLHSTCHFGVFPISGHFRTEMNWEIQQIGEIVPGVAMPVRWCLHRHAWLVDFRPSNERTVPWQSFPLKIAYFQGLCYQRVISTCWWNPHALFCRSKPRSFFAERDVPSHILCTLYTCINKYLYFIYSIHSISCAKKNLWIPRVNV
jgi:hypothetical protein